MPGRITLTEYTPTRVALPAEDQRMLASSPIKQFITLLPTEEPGVVEVNANQFVGVVRLPSGRTLDLLPKIPLFTVLWMISEVERLDIDILRLQQDEVTINTFEDILEPVARAFSDQVERLVDRGLYRTYIDTEDNLTAIRGRIGFREDLNHNVVLRHRTYCRFTEYSWDVPENQVIRQVVRKLVGWGFSQRLTGRLMALDRQMEDIQRGNLRASDIDRFNYSRQNEHYRPIHRFCRLFLDGFSLSEQIGDSPFDGFVMNMNTLFEEFVAIRLEQSLAKVHRELHLNRQASFRLFTAGTHNMRPDLVVEGRGQNLLVADTKYKREPGNPGDYYQVITYCTVLGLDTAVLIYPRNENEIDQSLRVRGSDITVREVSIDLRESQDAIERNFDDLALLFSRLSQRAILSARIA